MDHDVCSHYSFLRKTELVPRRLVNMFLQSRLEINKINRIKKKKKKTDWYFMGNIGEARESILHMSITF